MFSSENSTLVKILDTISLIFRFLSISFLIRSLELIAFSPLGYQLLCWVTGVELNYTWTYLYKIVASYRVLLLFKLWQVMSDMFVSVLRLFKYGLQ